MGQLPGAEGGRQFARRFCIHALGHQLSRRGLNGRGGTLRHGNSGDRLLQGIRLLAGLQQLLPALRYYPLISQGLG